MIRIRPMLQAFAEVLHYTNTDGRDLIDDWLSNLRDRRAVARIAARIERLALGLRGDCQSVKGGVMELRINYSPGYRVYFATTQKSVILLLYGGIKGTQQSDIAGLPWLRSFGDRIESRSDPPGVNSWESQRPENSR